MSKDNPTKQEGVLEALGEQEAPKVKIIEPAAPEKKAEEPKKEAPKQEVPKPVEPPKETAPAKPAVPPVATPDLTMQRKYLEEYLTKFKAHKVKDYKDATAAKTSAMLFGNIVNFITRYPEMELFERVIEFFRENKATILAPNVALQGMTDSPINSQSYNRYCMFYSLLNDIVKPGGIKRKDINMKVLEESFNHAGFINLFVRYLEKNK